VENHSVVRAGGVGVAVVGLVIVFAGSNLVGFIAMLVGFLVMAWSRTM
jgi:hypothetical protein